MSIAGAQPRVMIESPYAGDHCQNSLYLSRAIADSLDRGEAPFASHGFYTIYLDDSKENERALGIDCGHSWLRAAAYVALYEDYGRSPGMLATITLCTQFGIPVKSRFIGFNEDTTNG